METDYFVASDGVRIAVRDYGGNGAAIVLVHGHYGNLANFDELGPLLAQNHRVVAYDQRGHGWSDSAPMTLDNFVADLDAVVGAAGIQTPWLFGGSFGTLVALAYVQAGRSFAGLISEDGTCVDFESTAHYSAAPPDVPTIVTAEVYDQIVQGYAAAGTVGVSSAQRSAVRHPDGRFEIRPSPSDIHAKESAFLHVRVTEAYGACAGRALYLAAGREPYSEDRAALLDKLTGVAVKRFDTGHWISAMDRSGVAEAVATFIRTAG